MISSSAGLAAYMALDVAVVRASLARLSAAGRVSCTRGTTRWYMRKTASVAQ